MKAQKEVEEEMRQKAEEEAKQKAEEEEKQKAEVEAQRRAEMEVKARTEEVVWVQSLVMEQVGGLAPCYGCSGTGVARKMKAAGGDMQPMQQRKQEEVMSPQAGKKKAQV
ncbi:hypothetical protein PAXRUDRAFT_15434 [Paxillus rubicundulus Ve08.2h10]|uniref:Uncharacterized protein n=1 Tax=Paxillus rubicundulus Ve08.2h10 TaxID=930991 RepID=A0A0D0DHU7_9AGAM|nr:hypothetical protein PAXRUDRAFT_15434 [Paxillus rubicundulus Ve08.2h10]